MKKPNNKPYHILTYDNGRPAIMRNSDKDILTVNLPDVEIENGTAFIDTNNHPGAHVELIEAGMIDPAVIGSARSGFCLYPLYKLTA